MEETNPFSYAEVNNTIINRYEVHELPHNKTVSSHMNISFFPNLTSEKEDRGTYGECGQKTIIEKFGPL